MQDIASFYSFSEDDFCCADPKYFPKIHRSVPRKITIDLLFFLRHF